MRVLLVNHAAVVSGAERSMFELVVGLADQDDVAVACPRTGPLAQLLRGAGIAVKPVPVLTGGFKLHPIETGRLLVDLVRLGVRLRRHAAGVDVVHANSVRSGLACFFAFGPRWAPRRPRVVVHVRDSVPLSVVGRAVRRTISMAADHLIAISAHTAATWGKSDRMTIIHNPVDLARFHPQGVRASVPGRGPLLGVFGQITPWKGQDDAIRIVSSLRGKARLAVVGEAKFLDAGTKLDNRSFEAGLHGLASGAEVHFLGERADIPELMRACDIVLVPSWEEPFGRVVAEAMACGTPVVATNRGGPAEIIDDRVDGFLLPPRTPERWAELVRGLLEDEERCRTVAKAAAISAKRFDREVYVTRVRELYRSLRLPS